VAGPYLALLPDTVAPQRYGAAAGWITLMTLLGTFLGARLLPLCLPRLGHGGAYMVLAVVYLVTMLATCCHLKEGRLHHFSWPLSERNVVNSDVAEEGGFPLPKARKKFKEFLADVLRPFHDPDFWQAFWSMFFFTGGCNMMLQFLNYFTRDKTSEKIFHFLGMEIYVGRAAIALFLFSISFTALLAPLPAGSLSDKYGRRGLLYLSGGSLALIPILLAFYHPIVLAFIVSAVFGLGYGTYLTSALALAGDVLKRKDRHATDMAIWHIANTLPVVIMPAAGSMLLEWLEPASGHLKVNHIGFKVVFVLSGLLLLLSTIFIKHIQHPRFAGASTATPPSPSSSSPPSTQQRRRFLFRLRHLNNPNPQLSQYPNSANNNNNNNSNNNNNIDTERGLHNNNNTNMHNSESSVATVGFASSRIGATSQQDKRLLDT
jgi:MFS family permease